MLLPMHWCKVKSKWTKKARRKLAPQVRVIFFSLCKKWSNEFFSALLTYNQGKDGTILIMEKLDEVFSLPESLFRIFIQQLSVQEQ